MSLGHNPSIVTDSIVFAYDMSNVKSYKGPAIQNILTQITNNNTTNTGISVTAGTETLLVPQLGRMTVKYSSAQNNYPAVSGNCCPSPFTYGNGFAVSPSTLYTYSIVYKVDSGYTAANFMYRYEYVSNGGALTIEAGVHSNDRRIHLGDGWYWAWGTFTTQANTNWIGYTGLFYYRYSTASDRVYVAKAMLAQGDYSSMHPKYWPNVNTTRSNTQSALDWAGNNTITANSLTYTTDGSFSFNGSSDYISAPLSLGTDPIVTINQWIRRTADLNVAGYWGLGGGSANNGINGYTSVTNKIGWDLWGQTTFHTGQDYPLNTWVNVCWVKTGTSFTTSTLKIYINGVEFPLTTTVRNNSSTVNITSGFTVGRLTGGVAAYHAPGSVGVTQVYNRALTPAEVLQNYSALKGRYGL
jgi:hypothetical protein